MIENSNQLAVVIPYFKISYFEELLLSLSQQSVQKFNLYIGDDNSPNSPHEIIKKFENKVNITYLKFEKNLGGGDLVAHFNRCLNMVQNEEWVWMLPDDDVPSINVVEEFYKGLKFQKIYNIKIMRFPIDIIDKKSKIINKTDFKDPIVETNLNFYQRILNAETIASLGDNIFHKESLVSKGGFVNFPKAWASDRATILQVSEGGMIYLLSQARLCFRMSGENITSDRTDGLIKLDAIIMFAQWLKENEKIFPKKPKVDFYKNLYENVEEYVLDLKFDLKLFRKLYTVRKICMQSNNILPIVGTFLKKLKHLNIQKSI